MRLAIFFPQETRICFALRARARPQVGPRPACCSGGAPVRAFPVLTLPVAVCGVAAHMTLCNACLVIVCASHRGRETVDVENSRDKRERSGGIGGRCGEVSSHARARERAGSAAGANPGPNPEGQDKHEQSQPFFLPRPLLGFELCQRSLSNALSSKSRTWFRSQHSAVCNSSLPSRSSVPRSPVPRQHSIFHTNSHHALASQRIQTLAPTTCLD